MFGFDGPGGGFGAPGGGFSDNRSSGKPLLLLRLNNHPPGAPKPPPGPPKPKETKQKTKQKNKKTLFSPDPATDRQCLQGSNQRKFVREGFWWV